MFWRIFKTRTTLQVTKKKELKIETLRKEDEGNYTCSPSNMRSDSVIVTILSESKSPNALQDKAAAAGGRLHPPSYLNLALPFAQIFIAALLKAIIYGVLETIIYVH